MTLVVLEPRANDRPDLSPDYRDRFLLPDWREKRQAAIDRQHGKCAGCHRDDVPLQGHHLVYYRFREEGEWDILAVCKDCHPYADRFRKTHFTMLRGDVPCHRSGVPSFTWFVKHCLYDSWANIDRNRWYYTQSRLPGYIAWAKGQEDGA